MHGSHRGRHQTARFIGVTFPRRNHGLFTHNAFPINDGFRTERINNFPMSRLELNGFFSLIVNGNLVSIGIVELVIFEVGSFKKKPLQKHEFHE